VGWGGGGGGGGGGGKQRGRCGPWGGGGGQSVVDPVRGCVGGRSGGEG